MVPLSARERKFSYAENLSCGYTEISAKKSSKKIMDGQS